MLRRFAYADPGMVSDLSLNDGAAALASDPLQPPLSPPVTLAAAPPTSPAAVEPAEPAAVTAPSPPAAHAPSFVAPTPQLRHRVLVSLATGEQIEVAAHGDEGAARTEATALMRYLRDGRGDWPFLAGRFVRPETIVSIDVSA